MTRPWDTIVIGAGLGGLCAAAQLVKEGLRVLILEKNDHPGGTAYVYERKGFTFPMGPLGFSTPAFVRNTLMDLGHASGLEFRRVHYRVNAFGLDLAISKPLRRMKEELGRLFPRDRQGIIRVFDDIERTLSALGDPCSEIGRSELKKAETTAAGSYLQGLVTDWRLRRVIGSLGTHEPYSGLPLLAAMWGQMSQEGIWYPEGGMRAFCDRLVKAVTVPGGHPSGHGRIQLGSAVKRIRLLGGRVLGVTLEDGSEIDTPAIISNADYKTTFMRLIGPQFLQKSWYEAVRHARQTNSIFQVCLGIDEGRVDLSAFSEASRIIFRTGRHGHEKGARPDRSDEAFRPTSLASQEMEVSLWSREDPGLAPPGCGVIVIRTEADHADFQKYRPAPGKRISAYRPYKVELGQGLIEEAARLIPGLKKAIQVCDVATPLTFEERGGRSEGAVAGWSWDFEDNPHKPLELVRTPLSGLYMAGYQAYSALFMGGVPTALSSGFRAAEKVLGGAGPVGDFRLPWPFSENGHII